ncbi:MULTISPECIES: outer membrane lipoprotein carrier protein LolA [unclassified Caulobacter]|jgi:outer membrane lipoprotein-sorting protein|uniref:outer membrane lipoprotein carrier protein LolA n=1 Tax=unclassified Caulobacter TaxID=2648921 RepID=UPI0007845373|nr:MULTISPECIES: outer membrane lipoprotein carrier protein LolA [unclassified Caulobacter]AZS23222.1 outer membrane lipoprotein carrier protein LolA [Caulobacter sp. FWC26]
MTTRRTLLAAGLAAALASPALVSPAWAQGSTAPVPAKLTAEQKALLDKATAYIQGLSSAKGRFVQTDQRGTQTQGTFYLQRPGKARFAYDPPAGLLVVSNGNNVNIFDSRLKTYESYPLSKTPLNLLLAREVRLDRGVVITDVRPLADGFTIVAQDAKRQALGRISIDFSNSPVGLMGWTVTDIKGGQIRVRLADFAETADLDPKLFVLTDPRRKVGKP